MNETYRKLVDLYAGRELAQELESEIEVAAQSDASLAQDMSTLRQTVDTLYNLEAPEFTEESYQRILMRVYAKGIELQKRAPEPAYLQYQLPIQG